MKVQGINKAVYGFLRRIQAECWIAFFGIIITAVAWGSVINRMAHERTDRINDIYDLNNGLASALEEHVSRVLKSADDILLHMKMEYEDEGGLTKHLAAYVQKVKADPFYNQAAITNSDGDLLLSSVPLKKPISIANRQHFTEQKANPDAGLVIAEPVNSPVLGKWSVFLSRRLNRKDGSFAGIVCVGLDPGYFSDFYSVPELGRDRSIIVVGLDRVVLVRYFQNNLQIGQDMGASPLFSAVRKSPVGDYEGASAIDGLPMFVSYRKMRDYPLIVMVTSLKSSALSALEKRKNEYYSSALVFTLFTAVFCLLLIRAERQARSRKVLLIEELKERRRAEELLRISERRLRSKDRINNIFLSHNSDDAYRELLNCVLEYLESKYGIFCYLDGETFVSPSVTREIFWEECRIAEKDEIFSRVFFCSLWRRAFEQRTTLMFNEGPFKTPQGHIPIYNTMVAPVIFGSELISVIHIANKASGYTEDDRAFLDAISKQIAPVLYARIQRDNQDKERRKVEDFLRDSESRYSELFGAITDALFVHKFNPDSLPGRFFEVNDVACRMLGYTREELLTMTPVDINAPESVVDNAAIVHRMVAGDTLTFEQICVAKDGSRIPVESTVHRFDLQGKPVVLTMLRDIRGRKKKEQEIMNYQKLLQQLMYEETLLEERERKKIADELHDTIGQNLVFSKLRLSSFREILAAAGEADTLEEIIKMIDRTIKFSRSMTHELSNPVLYLVGFEAAVRWLAEQLGKTQSNQVEVNITGDLTDIQEEMSVLLYKTVRELLFNVVKHAHADHVTIDIRRMSDKVKIDVIDNGVGLDPLLNKGYGLFSISERINYLGGTMEIGPNTDTGTGARVSIVVPQPQNHTGRTSP